MMDQAQYDKLTTATFCDNAIRTVMLIDDDYVPYAELVDLCNEGRTELLKDSLKAAKIQKYFEEKKLICDISNGFTNFDHEKARKSDLLVIDYFLENDAPNKTIDILNNLSNSQHLNLVVIYTNQPLDTTWLQLAVSLKGGYQEDVDGLLDKEPLDFWNDKTDYGNDIPEKWKNTITLKDVSNYILGKKPDKATLGKINQDLSNSEKKYTKGIYTALCHDRIEDSDFDLLKNEISKSHLIGNYTGSKWIKFGNLFVCLASKHEDDLQGETISQTLKTALCSWNPNYHRLMLSEIENILENDGLSVSIFNDSDYREQTAWLWQLLSENSKIDHENLITQNQSIITKKLLKHEGLKEFAKKVTSCFSATFPQETVICENNKDNKQKIISKNTKVVENQIEYCLKHVSPESTYSTHEIAQAMNMSLSLKNNDSTYITTGSVLSDEDNNWFVCVSPACDCVPTQNNTKLTQRLAPDFKPLKLLELSKIKPSSALKDATDGKFIFLPDITLQVEGEPKIDIVIIHNQSLGQQQFNVSFLGKQDNLITTTAKILSIKAQLKEEYAARFQAMTSHHLGRIGVDYIKYGAS